MRKDIMKKNFFETCRVKGLHTKKKYRFRILAENLAGPGKPSSETDPVLIKDPIGIGHLSISANTRLSL